jgi:hypothetical protein
VGGRKHRDWHSVGVLDFLLWDLKIHDIRSGAATIERTVSFFLYMEPSEACEICRIICFLSQQMSESPILSYASDLRKHLLCDGSPCAAGGRPESLSVTSSLGVMAQWRQQALPSMPYKTSDLDIGGCEYFNGKSWTTKKGWQTARNTVRHDTPGRHATENNPRFLSAF